MSCGGGYDYFDSLILANVCSGIYDFPAPFYIAKRVRVGVARG